MEVFHMDQIITLISNVGFPIACCIVLFMQQNKLTQTLGEISNTMNLINERIDNIENNLQKGVKCKNANDL